MQPVEGIRGLTQREFGLLGLEHVAYVKRVVRDGTEGFAVHAADGTQIALLDTRDLAFAIVRQHEMEPVSVH
jgi:hypothetical protein